jgi:hypothetical protein
VNLGPLAWFEDAFEPESLAVDSISSESKLWQLSLISNEPHKAYLQILFALLWQLVNQLVITK